MSDAPTIAFTWEHKFMAAKVVMDEQKQSIAQLEKALAVATRELGVYEKCLIERVKGYSDTGFKAIFDSDLASCREALAQIAEIKKGTE